MKGRRLLRLLGYVAFGLLAFVISIYLTFPAPALAQRLAQELSDRTQGEWALEFGDVSTYRLSGVALEEVLIKHRSGVEALEVPIDALRVRLQLLPLLLLRLSVAAVVELGDGEIDATVSPGAAATQVQLSLRDVDLASPPMLSKLAGLPIRGKVAGDWEATWEATPLKSAGKGRLVLNGASVGPGTVAGFTVPSVGLGQVELALMLKNGKLTLSEFTQRGGDLKIELSGSSTLRPQVAHSALDACVKVRAEEAFLKDNPKVKTAIDLAQVSVQKAPDGYLHVPLSGTLASPRLRKGLCRAIPAQ